MSLALVILAKSEEEVESCIKSVKDLDAVVISGTPRKLDLPETLEVIWAPEHSWESLWVTSRGKLSLKRWWILPALPHFRYNIDIDKTKLSESVYGFEQKSGNLHLCVNGLFELNTWDQNFVFLESNSSNLIGTVSCKHLGYLSKKPFFHNLDHFKAHQRGLIAESLNLRDIATILYSEYPDVPNMIRLAILTGKPKWIKKLAHYEYPNILEILYKEGKPEMVRDIVKISPRFLGDPIANKYYGLSIFSENPGKALDILEGLNLDDLSEDPIIPKIIEAAYKFGKYNIHRCFTDFSGTDRSLFQLATCAYQSKDYEKSVKLLDKIITYPGDRDSWKLALHNMHFCIPHIENHYIEYPEKIVKSIVDRDIKNAKVTFTITTCKRNDLFTQTMNSFLNCCIDLHLIDQWVCIDDNTSPEDREVMKRLYPFFKWVWKPVYQKGHSKSMNILRDLMINGNSEIKPSEYIFHCEDDWKFYVKKPYIELLLDIIETDSNIGQALVNKNYAEIPTHYDCNHGFLKVSKSGWRYMEHEFNPGQSGHRYWPHFSFRPGLNKMSVWREIGKFAEDGFFEMEYAWRYRCKYVTTFLPNIYTKHIGRLTSERFSAAPNAYSLNAENQFGRTDLKISMNPELFQKLRPKGSKLELADSGTPILFQNLDAPGAIYIQTELSDPEDKEYLHFRTWKEFGKVTIWTLTKNFQELLDLDVEKQDEILTEFADPDLLLKYKYARVNNFLDLINGILAETVCIIPEGFELPEGFDPKLFPYNKPSEDFWQNTLESRKTLKYIWLTERSPLALVEKMLPELSIKSWVINLDRRPDRLHTFRKTTADILTINRFSAIDGQKLELTPDIKQLFDGNDFGWRKSFIGCALSHLTLWEKLINDTVDHYLIFEDDIEICKDWRGKLLTVMNNIGDADILFLGYSIWKHLPRKFGNDKIRIERITDVLPKLRDYMVAGIFGYIISKKCAKFFLERSKSGIKNGIDYWMMLHFGELKIYEVVPHIVFTEYVTDVGDSDIQKDYSHF